MARKGARRRVKAAEQDGSSSDDEDVETESQTCAAVRGVFLGAVAALVAIGLAWLVFGTSQNGVSPPVVSPTPPPTKVAPPPAQLPTIATTSTSGKPVGTWRDPSASQLLTQVSNKISEWQGMLKKVNYKEKSYAKLENKIAQLLKALDEKYEPAPRSSWEPEINSRLGPTYWAFARSRLLLEYYRDTRQNEKAYDAAMDALVNPVCPPQECAEMVLRNALLTAHRATRPDWAETAFNTARADPALRDLIRIGNHKKFPTMPEADLKIGDRPIKVHSKPFWTADVPSLGLPARVERGAAFVIDELANILKPDGSFVEVEKDKYMVARELEGFLPNARDLCDERVSGPKQCWQEFILYAADKDQSTTGVWNDAHCKLVPKTCAMLQHKDLIGMPPALGHKGVPGKASFIRLQAGKKINAHCGPHPYRVTCHLGLRIPDGAYVQATDEQQTWTEGKITAIDDAFVHHVNNVNTTHDRYILLFHIWHPSLIQQIGFDDESSARYPNAVEYEDDADEDEPADDVNYFSADDDDDEDGEAPPVVDADSIDDDDE